MRWLVYLVGILSGALFMVGQDARPALAACNNGDGQASLSNSFVLAWVDSGDDCESSESFDRIVVKRRAFDYTTNRSCVGQSSPDGAGYFDYRTDLDTGIRTVTIVCLRDSEPAVAGEPVVLPSSAEVWDRVAIPQPEVRLNPRIRGLVGLETRLWYDQATELTVDAGLPGIAVTATVRPVKFRWSFGNGDSVEAPGSRPGTEQNPAATYVFTQPCLPCEVSLTVTWGGSYTVTGLGAPITGDLGTRDIVSARSYDVIEVQARVVHER